MFRELSLLVMMIGILGYPVSGSGITSSEEDKVLVQLYDLITRSTKYDIDYHLYAKLITKSLHKYNINGDRVGNIQGYKTRVLGTILFSMDFQMFVKGVKENCHLDAILIPYKAFLDFYNGRCLPSDTVWGKMVGDSHNPYKMDVETAKASDNPVATNTHETNDEQMKWTHSSTEEQPNEIKSWRGFNTEPDSRRYVNLKPQNVSKDTKDNDQRNPFERPVPLMDMIKKPSNFKLYKL